MFKRLYAFGGIAYVLGGLGVLLAVSGLVVVSLGLIPGVVSSAVFKYALVAIFIGLAISTTIFNTGSMQVVAQNHTTRAVEKLSEQLAEQAAVEARGGRNSRRPRKPRMEELDVAPTQERAAASKDGAEAAPQKGYFCPVSKTYIAVR